MITEMKAERAVAVVLTLDPVKSQETGRTVPSKSIRSAVRLDDARVHGLFLSAALLMAAVLKAVLKLLVHWKKSQK